MVRLFDLKTTIILKLSQKLTVDFIKNKIYYYRLLSIEIDNIL